MNEIMMTVTGNINATPLGHSVLCGVRMRGRQTSRRSLCQIGVNNFGEGVVAGREVTAVACKLSGEPSFAC